MNEVSVMKRFMEEQNRARTPAAEFFAGYSGFSLVIVL
jgi:hypothetical protein